MRPISVLVISADRRFRSVASVLIARRGCAVATTENADRLEELAARVRADVVVIDADRTRASAAARTKAQRLGGVGVVIVEEEPAGSKVSGDLQALAKWGPFERLYAAIETADGDRSLHWGIDGRP
jgi:DNA-binding NtrC family response regulator